MLLELLQIMLNVEKIYMCTNKTKIRKYKIDIYIRSHSYQIFITQLLFQPDCSFKILPNLINVLDIVSGFSLMCDCH